MLNKAQAARLTDTAHWFRFWMPYQFQRIQQGSRRHIYLPLNRNYKPLGHTGRDHVDYEEYAAQAVVFGRDPHGFRDVWTDPEQLFLYNDSPASRVDYFDRYERLMSRHPKALKD